MVDKDRFTQYNFSARTILNHKFTAKHFLKTGVYYKTFIMTCYQKCGTTGNKA